MTTYRSLLVALLLTVAVGCSSSQQATTSPPTAETSAPADTVEAAREADRAPEAAPEATAGTLTEAPDDWYLLDAQADPFPGASVERAHRELLRGQTPEDTVIVAVIDSGIDTEHEDLRGVLWTNADEVPGNREDDDGNGYVDDIHGWNFIGGPDGENVDHDSYELARIVAALQARFEGMTAADVPAGEQADYERYQAFQEKFESQRQDLQEQLAQTEQIAQVIQAASGVLERHLGADSLTQDTVRAIQSEQQNVQQAQALMLRVYDAGFTLEDVREQQEALEGQLEYGYDLTFDPRSIVGDDYADTSERIYGNADVAGPDPSHGTIVAGIIGADRTNDLGIEGIASAVRIMSVRAVPDGDERDKDVANAIRYAVDNGADIINMSFGKGYSPQKAAVDEAVRYADEAGVLLVHAAGNSAANVDSTDNYPSPMYEGGGQAAGWIEVGASSWQGARQLAAPFSNYGAERVDLFAPGVDIYSTTPGQQYDRASGTSMAAPVVTGVAALIMAYYPDLSAAQVRQILLETATPYRGTQVARPGGQRAVDFGQLSATGGVVNAYAALQRAAEISSE